MRLFKFSGEVLRKTLHRAFHSPANKHCAALSSSSASTLLRPARAWTWCGGMEADDGRTEGEIQTRATRPWCGCCRHPGWRGSCSRWGAEAVSGASDARKPRLQTPPGSLGCHLKTPAERWGRRSGWRGSLRRKRWRRRWRRRRVRAGCEWS